MYAVIGATGKIGKRVAELLLADGKQVKAIGRDKEKLAGLVGKGAEAAVGNAEDTVFLAKTFSGAKAVFVMIPPNLAAPDVLSYQNAVGASISKAVSESGVKYVLHISSQGAQFGRGVGVVNGLHFQEERLNALPGVNVLHLRPGYFMENLFGTVPMIKGMGMLGSPLRPDLPMTMIATVDIGNYAADRLKHLDFSGKTVQDLLGQRNVTMKEVTSAIGNAIGKPDLNYVQFPYADALKAMVGMGMSQSMAESFVELNKALNEGTAGVATRNAGNTTPTSIEEFAKVFAGVYNS